MGKNLRGDIKELETPEVFQERDERGRRKINLRKNERQELRRQQLVEGAVALFLDLEAGHTWSDIAEELGISVQTLKDVTRSDDFMDLYSQYYAELGHDPRLQASIAGVMDLLPKAVNELRGMLSDASTPPTVRLNVIKEIFKMTGAMNVQGSKSDQEELRKFLKNSGVNIENINLGIVQPTIPDEYKDRYSPDIVDIEPEELPSLPEKTQDH